jgi:hypothetical protein
MPHTEPGLSIREHFAGLALQAIIGTAAAPCLTGGLEGAEQATAISAIKIADALIAELAKPSEPKCDVGADIETYLVERVEWLNREIKRGGDGIYLGRIREEAEYVLKNVRMIRARNSNG